MKKKKEISLSEEMNFPRQELEETLPFTKVQREEDIEEPDYLDEIPTKNSNQNRQSQPVMFNDERTDNIIMWQLRVDWERVEHIVRGHKPKIDKDGNEYFEPMKEHYLNDYGVNSILHFLSFYLSKEIFLARYMLEEKEQKMKLFEEQFTDFFYDNIEEFGLNTPQKKKMSKMFVHAVIDLVDASYSKAIEGKTAELINKQFLVSQNQSLDTPFMPNMNNPKPKPSVMQRIFG